jgi:hypothetical protein
MANYPVSGRSALATKLFAITTHCSVLIARYSLLTIRHSLLTSLPSEPAVARTTQIIRNSGKADAAFGCAVDIREEGRALSHLTCWRQVSPEGAGIAAPRAAAAAR